MTRAEADFLVNIISGVNLGYTSIVLFTFAISIDTLLASYRHVTTPLWRLFL